MTVAVLGNDPNHAKLHADTAAAQAKVNSLSPTGASHALYTTALIELRRAQDAEAEYCKVTGRISGAAILSTLS